MTSTSAWIDSFSLGLAWRMTISADLAITIYLGDFFHVFWCQFDVATTIMRPIDDPQPTSRLQMDQVAAIMLR
jgi:hypothetical protein